MTDHKVKKTYKRKTETKSFGRPSSYDKNFHPNDFIKQSKSGKQIIQIAASWDVTRQTIYEWRDRYPDFFDAFKKGREFCEAWWVNLGVAAMLGQASINGQKVKPDLGFFCYLTGATLGWRKEKPLEEDQVVLDTDVLPYEKN